MTRTALHLVTEPETVEQRAAESARVGKRVCDELRAEIMRRDWSSVHVQSDRRRPVELPDMRKGWRR